MKTIKVCYLLFVGLLVGCNPQPVQQKQTDQLAGMWSLHIMELQDPETGKWNEWRDGMQGYLLYDGVENMSLHLTVKGYQDTDLQFPNFNDTIALEALKHLTGSYVYLAKYKVEEENNIVQHSRVSHSNPAEWNDVVRRKFSFSGDTLVLRPTEETNAGLRLKWVRY